MKKWANQHRQSRNGYPSGTGLLDNEQKAHICILAREAADVRCDPGHFDEKELREWRREEQFKAVGKESLTDCVQADYLKLVAHFENLKGETGRALNAHLRAAVQDKEIALKKLHKECALRGLDISYPGKICLNKFKRTVDEATPRQLWCLVFDVRTSNKPIVSTARPARTTGAVRTSTPQLLNCPF
jgi:hypothetical protein